MKTIFALLTFLVLFTSAFAQSDTPDSLPTATAANETGTLMIEQPISGHATNDTQQISVANLFANRLTLGAATGTFGSTTITNSASIGGLTLGTGQLTWDVASASMFVASNSWFKGREAIGPQSGGVQTDHWLYSYILDNTTSAHAYNAGFYLTTSPSSASTATKYTVLNEMLAAGSGNQSGLLAAQFCKAQYDGSGYVTTLVNTKYDTKLMDNCTGSVGELTGIQFNLYATAGGHATNAFNEHFLSPLAVGVTNFPGIVAHQMFEDVTVGATNYGSVYNSDTVGVTLGKTARTTIFGDANGVHVTGNVTGSATINTNGFYLFSPNGTRYHIKVDNSGVLSTVAE